MPLKTESWKPSKDAWSEVGTASGPLVTKSVPVKGAYHNLDNLDDDDDYTDILEKSMNTLNSKDTNSKKTTTFNIIDEWNVRKLS